jgi:hypothetical protein
MTHHRRRRRILSNALTLGLVAASVVALPAAAQARPLARLYLFHLAAAWGDNEYGELGDGNLIQSDSGNFYGQLGNGTITASVTPVQVPGLSGVTEVSAGLYYSLAAHTTFFWH